LTATFFQGTFTEYHFGRELDFATGTLSPWNPEPWEEALQTSDGVGIGTPRDEAEAAYPTSYVLTFSGGAATCFNDAALPAQAGLGTLVPGTLLERLYLAPQRFGL